MRKLFFCLVILAAVCISSEAGSFAGNEKILVFCGAASKPAMEEAAEIFQKQTGIKVDLNFGGSGTMLSQMKMARRGDVYIPGSPDYMVKAEREGLVDPKSIKILTFLVPAIGVQTGNPKGIKSLEDLAKPGIKVGIGNPESVCVGLYAVELLQKNKLLRDVSKNIVTHASSCAATEALIAMKKVDAVIGWEVFSNWNPGKIETIFLKASEIPRLAYIPAGISTYATNSVAAQKFIDFLALGEGRKIFAKWGYAVTEKEARRYAPNALIGGEYLLPKDWNAQ
jgi:molybdate transport system substrate-binding protein